MAPKGAVPRARCLDPIRQPYSAAAVAFCSSQDEQKVLWMSDEASSSKRRAGRLRVTGWGLVGLGPVLGLFWDCFGRFWEVWDCFGIVLGLFWEVWGCLGRF